MMFKQNFVCSLKVGGRILRENLGVVGLPFGSEYGVLLKNLNSRRAMVKVSVDGQDATEGTRLILDPNGSLELERFIRNGNLDAGNRFKFIERTEDIEAHRGIKENDGLIRAEFWSEREVIENPIRRPRYYDDWYPVPRPSPKPNPWWGRRVTMASSGPRASRSSGSGILRSMSAQSNDTGITVPGSESFQKFRSTSGFGLESRSHVIVLQLRGEAQGEPIAVPITVDKKTVCPACGKRNKSDSSFCSKCGTALRLI